jgi:molybdenum cofactor cytidylyltransferase
MISAIVLAAGQAKRMGKQKLLLPFGRSTILEQSIDNLLSSNVDEIIIVVGGQAQEIMGRIANRPVKTVVNLDYRRGMSTSIIKGLSLVDEESQGIMLVLGDQPLIDNATINHLIEAFFSHNNGITLPKYDGKRGHPVIFSLKYRSELSHLKGDIGGKQIIDEHPDDVLEVETNTPSINIDIDTPDDYKSAIS